MAAVGIDVGATNIKIVAVTEAGEIIYQAQEPTDETAFAWAKRIQQQLRRIEAQQNAPPACIGIAAPGLAAPDGRSIAWMQGRMAAVQGLDWTTYLHSQQTIPVLNDAHAALLGEAWIGAAAGSRNVIMLTLGTGVGGGALVDGHLLRGHIGRGGHLGHICLNPDAPLDIVATPGSLEDAIGDCTILQRSQGRFTSTAQLVQAVQSGDREAEHIWQRSVYHLACGLTSLINTLDPEVVILGGGIAAAGELLFHPLQQHLDRIEWRPTGTQVRLARAQLGETAGAVGAAYHAIRMLGSEPHGSSGKETQK